MGAILVCLFRFDVGLSKFTVNISVFVLLHFDFNRSTVYKISLGFCSFTNRAT